MAEKMNLDETIKHTEEIAKLNRDEYAEYGGELQLQCAEYHEQLAEWLKELKDYREHVILCKDCKFFEYDHFEKVHTGNSNYVPLIVAHEMCTMWGKGCKTSEHGFCFLAERKEVEE